MEDSNALGLWMGDGPGTRMVMIVIFWILVILGIAYLIKFIFGSSRKEGREETAMDILKKRYAKGEINKEEFEKMKDDLTKS